MQSSLTVTTPASTQDLISLYTVRQELDIVVDSYDLRLSRWISDASSRISDYCGRQFRLETLTETFWADSHAREPAVLTRWPVVSVASVTDNGEALSTDYYRLRGQRLWRISSEAEIAFSRPGEVVVVYDAGYAQVSDVPGVLQRACLYLIKDYWTTRMRDSAISRERLEIPGVELIDNQYFDRLNLPAELLTSGLPYQIAQSLANFCDVMV